MNFIDAINAGFKGYVVFTGRAVRSEYWYWVLFSVIAQVILSVIYKPLDWVFILATFLPSVAVAVRRLHDIDKSGWWLLIGFIPILGAIYLIWQFCIPGTAGPNRFGEPRALAVLPAPAA